MRKYATTVAAVLEALRDVRIERDTIRLSRWIGTEAARVIDSILKGASGYWDAESNGYQFPTAATSVLQRILEGTPRPPANRLATFETPETLADKMRDLVAITPTDHVLEPGAGRGRLIAKLPRQRREGAMSVSQTNFLDHVGKGHGYFGTFFNSILMTSPRRQNEDLRQVMAAWDCLAPGGTLVAMVSPGWERPANERELALVCDGSCASGGTIRRHLQRIRTADAIEAHLGGKRTSHPMSLILDRLAVSGLVLLADTLTAHASFSGSVFEG